MGIKKIKKIIKWADPVGQLLGVHGKKKKGGRTTLSTTGPQRTSIAGEEEEEGLQTEAPQQGFKHGGLVTRGSDISRHSGKFTIY